MIWQALQAAMVATASNDYDMLARALCTVGATSSDVDTTVSCHSESWTMKVEKYVCIGVISLMTKYMCLCRLSSPVFLAFAAFLSMNH